MPAAITIHTAGTTAEDVCAVARDRATVTISPSALSAVAESRAVVERLAAGETPSYGISTGFGALAQRHIPLESRVQLQRSLIRSHAAGMGPLVEEEVVPRADVSTPEDAVLRTYRCSAGGA